MRFLDWLLPGWLFPNWLLPARKLLGNKSELLAASLLLDKGFNILAKNWSCKFGELDIVARFKDTLVFVEVRSRSCDDTVIPAESVGRTKQLKLCRTAAAFIRKHRLHNVLCRFDVIAIAWKKNIPNPVISHYEHAFDYHS